MGPKPRGRRGWRGGRSWRGWQGGRSHEGTVADGAARAAKAPELAGRLRPRGALKPATPSSAPRRPESPYSFVAKMPSSTFAISSMLMGLAMWPFMPASNDFFLSSSKAFAVMATMGMFAFLLLWSVRISLVAM